MDPILILFGLVFGRWWRATLFTAVVGWPVFLVTSDPAGLEWRLLSDVGSALISVSLGVIIHQTGLRVARRSLGSPDEPPCRSVIVARGPLASSPRFPLSAEEEASRERAALAWELLLDGLHEFAELTMVDALPNDAWEGYERLPEPAKRAQEQLVALGRAQGLRDPSVRVELDLSDNGHLELLKVWGPYTIGAEVHDVADREILCAVSDEGGPAYAEVTPTMLVRLVEECAAQNKRFFDLFTTDRTDFLEDAPRG